MSAPANPSPTSSTDLSTPSAERAFADAYATWKRDKFKARQADVLRRFDYYPGDPDQVVVYETIRAKCKAAALLIQTSCPDNRESNLAITKLEEAMQWAIASLVRYPSPTPAPK